MGDVKYTKIENGVLVAAVVVLAWFGHELFSQFLDYSYKSPEHLDDFIRVKLFTLVMLLLSFLVIYMVRERESASKWAVFFLSAHFIVMYGYLFRGTEYGMNGHLGDNAYRLAITCKMMAYNYFADANIKSLTTFYPPLWMWLMATYAKIIGIEAYQTIKFGYLLIFVVYPWLIYLSWKALVTRAEAAAIAVAVILFAYNYLDYCPYEHITAALFVPWWLYYFENAPGVDVAIKRHWRFYLFGSIFGALLFMTYYWWYFMAFAAVPVITIVKWLETRSFRVVMLKLMQQLLLMIGVAIFSVFYWFPLLVSTIKYGLTSNQAVWFNLHYLHISDYWKNFLWEGLIIFLGVFLLGYLWFRWKHTKLAYLYLGGVLVIVLDRYLNLGMVSIQTRKVLEYSHIFLVIPIAIGAISVWSGNTCNKPLRYGLVTLFLILAITFSDKQSSEIFSFERYSNGLNSRKPIEALKIMDNVDCNDAVFLTHKVFETCYLPFHKFLSNSNVGAHINERHQARIEFLEKLSDVNDPEYLAYFLSYNKYDTVDYVFLPANDSTASFDLVLYMRPFGGTNVKKVLRLPKEPIDNSTFFLKKHRSGLFKIAPPVRSQNLDEQIRERFPNLYSELR